MCQFIETVRIVDGEILNLSYHQDRLVRTQTYFWAQTPKWELQGALENRPTEKGVFKARVIYGKEGILEVGFSPYSVRDIRSLCLIPSDDIDYQFKSTNRSHLQDLLGKKGGADEIIIVKYGLLTDTSYSNIALLKERKWYTPRTPLLKGTMRQSLIDKGVLIEKDIFAEKIGQYEKVALINAMMPLGVCEVEVSK